MYDQLWRQENEESEAVKVGDLAEYHSVYLVFESSRKGSCTREQKTHGGFFEVSPPSHDDVNVIPIWPSLKKDLASTTRC